MNKTFWVLIVVMAVVLAGCGAGQPAPTVPKTSGGPIFQIALPRLVVDVDGEGNPSILGISPALLGAFGVDTSTMRVPAQTVEQMTRGGVQHIEIASVGDRLVLFANGQPLPHLAYTPDSLDRALKLVETLDVQNAALLQTLVPLITRLGLDVVLRFPRGEGVAEIPMTEPGAGQEFAPSPSADPASAIVMMEATFDENGVAGGNPLLDLLAQMTGKPLLQLAPEMIQKLQQGNVQNLEFRMKPDGAHIYANGEALPNLIWDSQLLKNLTGLFAQLAPDNQFLPLIQQIVPYLDRGDVGILLKFPPAPGAEPIPAQMHQ